MRIGYADKLLSNIHFTCYCKNKKAGRDFEGVI